MNYAVFILRRAHKELAQLSSESFDRVREAIRELANNPRPPGCLKLTGREGWRMRVGDYRVLYEIDDARQIGAALPIPSSGRPTAKARTASEADSPWHDFEMPRV